MRTPGFILHNREEKPYNSFYHFLFRIRVGPLVLILN